MGPIRATLFGRGWFQGHGTGPATAWGILNMAIPGATFQSPIGNVPFGTSASARPGRIVRKDREMVSLVRPGPWLGSPPRGCPGIGVSGADGNNNGQCRWRAGKLQSDAIKTRGTCCENPCAVHFGYCLVSGHRLRGRPAHSYADARTDRHASTYGNSRTNCYASTYTHAGSHRYAGPHTHTDAHAYS